MSGLLMTQSPPDQGETGESCAYWLCHPLAVAIPGSFHSQRSEMDMHKNSLELPRLRGLEIQVLLKHTWSSQIGCFSA